MGKACSMQEAMKIVIKFLCVLTLSFSDKTNEYQAFVYGNEPSVSAKVRNV